jgi:lysophospholipase L1-like esterase
LRRWKEVAASLPPISPTPTITLVLVQFGANDLRVFGHSERTVRETAGRIRQVCDRIRAHYGGPGTTGEKVGAALVVPPMIFPDELTLRLREAGFGPETPRFLRLLRDA